MNEPQTRTKYGYDSVYQLLSATQGGSATENYSYDSVGNRLTSLAGNYSNNNSNELTSSPTATLTYDNNGNTLSKTDSSGSTSYNWDFENHLAGVTLPASAGTVSFKYDPFGRRIQKTSASATTNFVYDGSNSLEEVDGSGNLTARYTQTQSIDEPLAMVRSGTTSFYNADGIGSVSSLSNSSGALAQTYTFDSFGNLTNSTGTLTNPFRYSGREFDSETNLYYYRARYYDAASGRFVGEDPNKSVVGGMNFYAYVRNNSPNLIDPYGRGPWDWLKKVFEGVKLGHETKEKIEKPIDWAFCGLYYESCLETALGIKEDLAHALNSSDPNTSATALITLQQQLQVTDMSALNLKACIQGNENCKKAFECADKGLTNPLPFPSSNWFTDLLSTAKELKNSLGGTQKTNKE